MSRSPLARLGLAVLAVVLTTTSLAAPARAAAETGTIQGQLTGTTGAPVESAWVAVYTADTEEHLADTHTDADGRFTVADVAVGDVKVGFEVGGVDLWATGKRTFEDATVFTVRAGQTLTVNDRLLPTGTITGRLTTATGAPVTSAEVSTWSPTDNGTVPYGYVDEDGRYAVDVLPGEYTVQFRLDALEQWAYGQRERTAARTFTVAAGQRVVVDDVLPPTGSISGTLLDAAGKPLPGAHVGLHTGDDNPGVKTTDDDGRYSFDTVLTGDYTISFTIDGGATQWAHGKGSQATATAITVRAGQNTIVDERFGATGSIAGRFTDADGRGLAGHTVEVSAPGNDDDLLFQVETDAQGNYRINDVLAGEYVVGFRNQRTWRRQYAYGKTTAAAADLITVRAGETTTVNDTRLASAQLRVTARDAATGASVSNICVWVSGPAEGGDCTTGPEIVVGDLGPGSYQIMVNANEGGLYLPAEATATVTAGQSVAVVVPMRQGGAVQTTVTDRATGRPLADACLIVTRRGNGFPAEGGNCTDEQGRVRSEPLPPGTYTAFVNPPYESTYGAQWVGRSAGTGDQRQAVQITVRAGQVASAPAVKLDPAGTITGTVSTADGAPVDGGSVSYSAWDFGVGPSRDAEIDSTGRYTLTGLGPYEWPVLFTAWGAPRQWSGGTGDRFKAAKVRVKAGASVRYDIGLRKGAAVRGTVTRPGAPIGSGRLTAYNAVTGDPIGVADFEADGRYQMPLIGSQNIKIRYYVDGDPDIEGDQSDGWYDRAADLAHARAVPVPANGTRTLDITIR